MDLSTVANVATALTVITGVGFGLVEAQRSRRARQERAAYAAVQALLSQAWMKSMIVVHSIPDGSSASAIEASVDVLNAAHSVGVILEGLGYSVYARIVPLRVVADLVGGTVRLAWRKLEPYVEEERRRSGSARITSCITVTSIAPWSRPSASLVSTRSMPGLKALISTTWITTPTSISSAAIPFSILAATIR